MDPNHIVAFAHPRPTKGAPTHSDEGLVVWTPVLGPTAMLLAYRLAGDVESDGLTTYSLEGLATDLGVAPGKVAAAIKRLGRYDVAEISGTEVAIRLALPAAPRTRQPAEALTMSVIEAAELLGISRSKAYEAVHSGEIPSVSIGRRIVIPRRPLLEMLEGR
jgi:excisionase family DNA binding protein